MMMMVSDGNTAIEPIVVIITRRKMTVNNY